jgi:hypothetical protein
VSGSHGHLARVSASGGSKQQLRKLVNLTKSQPSSGNWTQRYISDPVKATVAAGARNVLLADSENECDADVVDWEALVAQHGPKGAEDVLTELFLYDHYVPRRPLLVRGYVKNWKLRDKWSLTRFLAAYGALGANIGVIPYVSSSVYVCLTCLLVQIKHNRHLHRLAGPSVWAERFSNLDC